MKKDEHRYDDLLNISRPIHRHACMSQEARAAQFAPFAALSGYGEEIHERARRTTRRIELEESEQMKLNEKLRILQTHVKEQPKIEVIYFVADGTKSGGSYHERNDYVKKMNVTEQWLMLENKEKIAYFDILEIYSDLFSDCFDIKL